MQFSLISALLLASSAMGAPKTASKRSNSTDFQFPILTNAFTFEVPISGLYEVGSTTDGDQIVITGSSGTIVNEDSFTDIVWSGDLIFGSDFLHDFTNAPHRTLDGHGLFKTSTGTYVTWTCTGVTSNTTIPTVTETQARGFAVFTFETGDETLAALAESVWVSSLHFVIGASYPALEFKISRVDYIDGTLV